MKKIFLAIGSFVTFISCAQNNNADLNTKIKAMTDNTPKPATSSSDTATFGTGCFWCTEAVFQQVEGVIKVTSGYSGGYVENPSYQEVCTGTTGHAECLNIVFDPSKISFDELLEMFWQVHDPTSLNRQGADAGHTIPQCSVLS
jgi:peptide-methionine (S)-S-oxide reductase